jgi:hypothetical protein
MKRFIIILSLIFFILAIVVKPDSAQGNTTEDKVQVVHVDKNHNIIGIEYVDKKDLKESSISINELYEEMDKKTYNMNTLDSSSFNFKNINLPNGALALYLQDDDGFYLNAGDHVKITVDLNPESDGMIVVGYQKDNNYVDIYQNSVSDIAEAVFTAPESGNYKFYNVGASAGDTQIDELTISISNN